MSQSQSTADASGADTALATSPRAEGLYEELWTGRGAQGRRPRGLSGRGPRPGRRQRRRQVHPDQGGLRGAARGLRRGDLGGPHHAADHAARRDRARDRDRISGPRVGREPRRGRQPVPGPGGRQHRARRPRPRRGRDGAEVGRAVELARGDDAAQRAHRGRLAVGRTATGGGDRPLAARRAQDGAPGRADRSARDRADRPDPEADRAAARARPGGDRDQSQPRQRVRGLGPDRGPAPRPPRGDLQGRRREPTRTSSPRSPVPMSGSERRRRRHCERRVRNQSGWRADREPRPRTPAPASPCAGRSPPSPAATLLRSGFCSGSRSSGPSSRSPTTAS